MTSARSRGFDQATSGVGVVQINLNNYYGDSEPQGVYDSYLTGKLGALVLFCRKLEWSELASQINELLPLRGNAPEGLTRMQGFVLPEIRHLLEHTVLDDSTSRSHHLLEQMEAQSNQTSATASNKRAISIRPPFEQRH